MDSGEEKAQDNAIKNKKRRNDLTRDQTKCLAKKGKNFPCNLSNIADDKLSPDQLEACFDKEHNFENAKNFPCNLSGETLTEELCNIKVSHEKKVKCLEQLADQKTCFAKAENYPC